MKTYISFGGSSNTALVDEPERNIEQWARRISREIGLSYAHALALVRANMPITETRRE